MMHIGIVTSEFPPDIGGVETYAIEFSKALVGLGYTVSVFLPAHHTVSPDYEGITLHPILKFSKRLDWPLLNQFDVDAWHVMNAAHSWISAMTDKPVVVSIHGNDFLNPYPLTGSLALSTFGPLWRISTWLKPFDRWLAKVLTKKLLNDSLHQATVILSNSGYTEKVFLEKFPRCRGKTVVAQVGVGVDFLNSEISRERNPVAQLLTVSRLSEPRKNVDRVIQALSRLNSQFDFCYTVIGDGEIKKELETLVVQLGLRDKIKFIGRQPFDNVIKQMVKADLFLLPSSILPNSHEGFGIVYLEAAACGTPSLATRQAGAVEAVEEGVSGFFVEEPSVDEIYSALYKFLSNEVHFDKNSCREFASHFSWKRVVEKALPYYVQ